MRPIALIAAVALLVAGLAQPVIVAAHDETNSAQLVWLPTFTGPGVRSFSSYSTHDSSPPCHPVFHTVKTVTSFSYISAVKAYVTSITYYYSQSSDAGALYGGTVQIATGNQNEWYQYRGDLLTPYYYHANAWSGSYTIPINHWFTRTGTQLHIYLEHHTDTGVYVDGDCHHVSAMIYLKNS
jgi:hypothetical protein